MNHSLPQKLAIIYLSIFGFYICGINSFGQYGPRSLIIQRCSTDRLHGRYQLRDENSRRKTGIRLSVSSTNRQNVRPKGGMQRKFQRPHYQNEFGELNRKITQQECAQDILGVLASTKGALSQNGGGGKMSTVNFSTSIHRIARHVTLYNSKNQPGNDRSKILSDPRFALLMCSTAEALLDGAEKTDFHERKPFGAREIANIAWAIAKINIAPPNSVMPIDTASAASLLREKSEIVRSAIFDVAKQRASTGSSSSSSTSSWIPTLSELCGLMVDTMSEKAMELGSKRFQQQELSNLIWALATVQRPNQDVFEFVVKSIVASAEDRKQRTMHNKNSSQSKNVGNQRDLTPQEWSIPLWVLAKSGTDLGHEEELLPYVDEMMENEDGFLERFKPQELTNSVWAVATIISKRRQRAKGAASDAALGILRHTTREIIRRQGEGYKTQELTNHAWAMATLGFGVTASQAAINAAGCQLTHSYIYLHSDDPQGDQALMEEAMKIIILNSKKSLRWFTSQELNNMCWAIARLDQKNVELVGMIGRELTNPRKKVASQDLSTSLWSMATMEYFDEELYRSIVARFHEIGIRRFKPQEMSNTLWALATAGVAPKYTTAFDDKLLPSKVRPVFEEAMRDPVTAFFGASAAEFSRRPHDFKSQELKDLVWSFVRTGVRHPKLFQSVAEHLVGKGDHQKMTGRGMSEFNTQGLANIAYSYARHAQLGEETMDKYKYNCGLPYTAGKLACYAIAYLDVGEGLLRKLYVEIARANIEVHDNLSKCALQDISNTLWAMGILGLKHRTYLESAEIILRQRMSAYVAGNRSPSNYIRGQEVGNALWGFATLDYKPTGLLSLVGEYWTEMLDGDLMVSKLCQYISRQEMAMICWSAAVYGEYPEKLIKILYNGILGVYEELDPDYMQKELYKDNGISPSHFNSLLYLQMMMDLELGADKNPFSLPENFPSAWTSNQAFNGQSEDSKSSISPSWDNRDGNSTMTLSTSATQNRISDAFDRIDFGHVDEHTLTMKDMVKQFDIQMSPLSIDILSLDMANVDAKIGVEVDGPGHWISNIDPSENQNIFSSAGTYKESKSKNGDPTFEYTFKWNSEDQVINGSTRLKLRLFDKLGWTIINIPFWEWLPVESPSLTKEEQIEAQNNYCRALLQSKN